MEVTPDLERFLRPNASLVLMFRAEVLTFHLITSSRFSRFTIRLSSNEQQRSTIRDACWLEAQKFLSDYWPAVGALATKLLKRRTLDGRDVHRIIWQTIGYPDADWRFGALNIQREQST